MASASSAAFIYALVSQAEDSGVSLTIANEGLRFRAIPGAMSESLREQLKENKSAIISALSEPTFRTHAPSTRVPVLTFNRALWTYVVSDTLGVWFSNAPQWVARIREQLDLNALQAAVNLLVARHAILGSKVVVTESGPEFEFGQAVTILFEDISTTNPESREELATTRAGECAWRPFDTGSEPLLRVFVLKLSQADYVIGFVIHHFIADTHSVMVFERELGAAYAQVAGGSTASLPGTPLQYADYVSGYNEWLAGPALEFRLAYWKQQMRAAAASRLPPDHPLDLDQDSTFSAHPIRFDPQAVLELRDLASRLNATLFLVLLAAQVSALRQCLASSDIVVLVMHHSRDNLPLAGMIGSMQNQIPLRIRLANEMSFQMLTAELGRVCAAAYQYQIPYHYVRNALPEIGTPNMFTELHFRDEPHSSSDASPMQSPGVISRLKRSPPPGKVSSPRMSPGPKLALYVGANEIVGGVDYLTAQYDASTIARFADLFRAILAQAVKDPTRVPDVA